MAFRLLGEVLKELLRGGVAFEADDDDDDDEWPRRSRGPTPVLWPGVNTDGTPMTETGIDVQGKPYGL